MEVYVWVIIMSVVIIVILILWGNTLLGHSNNKMEECVFGVLKHKTRVLVTNQVHWLKHCTAENGGQVVLC